MKMSTADDISCNSNSVWRRAWLSAFFLILGVVFAGGWAYFYLTGQGVERAEASPDDVYGSRNVAVAAYNNSNGNFLVWASGDITDTEGTLVNGRSQYLSTKGATAAPKPQDGYMLGSQHVAVDVIQNSKGSFVLFSDGSVRRPAVDKAAAAKNSGNLRMAYIQITCGKVLTMPQFVYGGIERKGMTNTMYGSMAEYAFTEPFQEQVIGFVNGRALSEYGVAGNSSGGQRAYELTLEHFATNDLYIYSSTTKVFDYVFVGQ